MDLAQLVNLFTYHPPHGTQVERYKALREQGLVLAKAIFDNVPASIERDRAIMQVREAVMMANAGIACNESGVTT